MTTQSARGTGSQAALILADKRESEGSLQKAVQILVQAANQNRKLLEDKH